MRDAALFGRIEKLISRGLKVLNKNEAALKMLKNIIGEELYQRVCEQMPGADLHIPALRGGFISKAERDAALRIDFYAGMTAYQLADRYGVSISQAYKIIQNS